MKTHKVDSGLTLIEVICVTAIMAMLLAALGETLNLTMRGTIQARAVIKEARVYSGVDRILRQDIAAACAIPDDKLYAFVGRPFSSLQYEPAMEFFTLHSEGGDPGNIRRVVYTLKAQETPDGGQGEPVYDLYRSEAPWHPGAKLPEAPQERLAAGIASFSMAFYNGMEWREGWQANTLPPAMELRIGFKREGQISTSEFIFSPLVGLSSNPLPPTP